MDNGDKDGDGDGAAAADGPENVKGDRRIILGIGFKTNKVLGF